MDTLTASRRQHLWIVSEQGASPYGARNMVGNVAEWVADWFDAEYYAVRSCGKPERSPNKRDGEKIVARCKLVCRFRADAVRPFGNTTTSSQVDKYSDSDAQKMHRKWSSPRIGFWHADPYQKLNSQFGDSDLSTRLVTLWIIFNCALFLFGCSENEPSEMTGMSEKGDDIFTAREWSVIQRLSPMPETPPPNPTNGLPMTQRPRS